MAIPKEQRVRVFRNGRSRAVRIPKEFDFDGDEVIFRKERTGKLVIEPVVRKRTPRELVEWLRSQPALDVELPDVEDFPPEPVELEEPQ
jgi:antitoxin VapB